LLLTDLVDTHTLDNNNGELFTKITKVAHGLNSTLNDLSQAILIRESVVAAEQLSFRNITDKLLEIMESEISNGGARVTYDFKVKGILFPKLYLESILMNLISNSIKYKKDDEAADIKIRTYPDKNGRIVLECEDNGIGIDLRLHGSKIFGLYKTFHTHKEAHGVGLFLVKTQVESQGGMISVSSQLGKGSTFKITF
jgi:light-regulated signal transduction histidine kinase (bacteriophytochrome)